MKSSLSPNIIVINHGSIPEAESRMYFENFGIQRFRDYILFYGFGERELEKVTPNIRQMVFTSHNPPDCDSLEVSAKIKDKNPLAIVFALTSSSLSGIGRLDGVINKLLLKNPRLPSEIVKEFLNNKSREELVAMLA